MRTLLRHRWIVTTCRMGVALVFIFAGLAKIGDAASFVLQVHNFQLVPIVLENGVAILLPWIEVIAGLALLMGGRRRAGAWIVFILMGIFTVAVAAAVARGLDIECGCFGTGDATRVGLTKLIENGLLTIAAWLGTTRLGDES